MSETTVQLREKILEYYNMDIDEASSSFSSRNYAYIFPDEAIIRVSIGASRTRSQLMSELLWLDEIKQYSDTVCEPYPSLHNNFFEQFEIDGVNYSATKFKKARGGLLKGAELDGWAVMHIGELLGRIHKASLEAEKSSLRYKRPTWTEMETFDIDAVSGILSPATVEKARRNIAEVNALEKDINSFGMVHGDFGSNNYYMEGNNVWVFDFDDCHYNFYMFDIASTIFSWFYLPDFQSTAGSKAALFEGKLLESFRRGYERHMRLPEEQWEQLELFLTFRFTFIMIILATFAKNDMGEGGAISDVSQLIPPMETLYGIGDIYQAIDAIVAGTKDVASQGVNTEFMQGPQKKEVDAGGFQVVSQDGNTVCIAGRISFDTAPMLEEHLEGMLEAAPESLVLDFKDVTFLSSAGIRVLLKTYKALDGRLALVNVNGSIEEVLDTVGLGEYFIKDDDK